MVSVLDLGEGALSPQLIFRSWTEAHKAQPRPQMLAIGMRLNKAKKKHKKDQRPISRKSQ